MQLFILKKIDSIVPYRTQFVDRDVIHPWSKDSHFLSTKTKGGGYFKQLILLHLVEQKKNILNNIKHFANKFYFCVDFNIWNKNFDEFFLNHIIRFSLLLVLKSAYALNGNLMSWQVKMSLKLSAMNRWSSYICDRGELASLGCLLQYCFC